MFRGFLTSHLHGSKIMRELGVVLVIYGYSRVSSVSQSLDSQVQTLKTYGCEKIFREKVSGRTLQRPQFQKLLETVAQGDMIVVTKLDRFARSTKDALSTIDILDHKGVSLVVLNMGGDVVNTSTPIGKLMITVLAGIAEFEADMIKERQLEGIATARERGVYKGRPKTYSIAHKGLQYALNLLENRTQNKMTVDEISVITNISRSTLYRALRKGGTS